MFSLGLGLWQIQEVYFFGFVEYIYVLNVFSETKLLIGGG